jgi:O-antigen/teichoic acid export membrane protein
VRTRVLKESGALATGTVAGGLLAYAFFALTIRTLGATDAAPVSVLWTYWTMTAAILTFPLQHWTIRLLTRGDEGTLARSHRRLWVGTAVVSAFSGLLAYVARDVLFHDRTVAYPIMAAGVTAEAALSGLVRGALSGRGRFTATGVSMAAENLVRVALGVAAAIAGGGAIAFGLVLVAGPLSGCFWLSSLRFDHRSSGTGSIASPLALATGLATGSLIAQIVLMGGPVALAALGGAPGQVTALFVTLAVWRAPYLVALGVAPRLTPALTRMTVAGDEQRLLRVRRWILLAVLGASAGAFLAGATIVGPVLRVVFGTEVVLDWQTVALIGVGTAAAVGNLALLLLMLALGSSRPVNRAWLIAVVVVAAILVAVPVDPLNRVVTAFVAAQLTAFALLLASPLRGQQAPATPEAADATIQTPLGT